MADKLSGLKIAMLVTNGFEQPEMEEPRKALQDEGAQVDLISPIAGKVRAWNNNNGAPNLPLMYHWKKPARVIMMHLFYLVV